ncbi:MAG: QueT transporter family protein [Bacilli bacterium]
MKKNLLDAIVYNASIAAIYVVVTLITYPISYRGIQFRFAEILMIFCFFRKEYAFGLTIGCMISNLMSPLGIIDIAFGTIATLLSCILMMYSKHLLVAISFPVIINAILVGLELLIVFQEPFFISLLTVGLGELVVLVVGYILFMCFKKKKTCYKFLRFNQNLDFKF